MTEFTVMLTDQTTNFPINVRVRAQVEFGVEPEYDRATGVQTAAGCGDVAYIHSLLFLDLNDEGRQWIPAEMFPRDWLKRLEMAAIEQAIFDNQNNTDHEP